MTPKRPTRIRVGPYVFTVEWSATAWADAQQAAGSPFDAEMGRSYGYTDRYSSRIWINPHAVHEYQREALLHEVMHACQAVAVLPNGATATPVTGEDFITRISPILLDTLDRNPGLRAYLFGPRP